jgi:NAD+ diphosphatase
MLDRLPDPDHLFDFRSAVEPFEGSPDEPGWWFFVRGSELLVIEEGDRAAFPLLAEPGDLALTIVSRQFLGVLGERSCWSAELPADAAAPPGTRFSALRPLYPLLPERLWVLAGRALQIVEWDRTHRFCGRCGAATEPVPGERAKRCPVCGLSSYPRISPAVITLIERGDRILLARGHSFAPGMYGIIAGFVEPGESLEEAVVREIREEVSIEVDQVRYFGSQPWPFPHGIMLGFNARWAAGELQPDPAEIEVAGWFGIDDLPALPSKLSIARRLVDDWLRRQGREPAE